MPDDLGAAPFVFKGAVFLHASSRRAPSDKASRRHHCPASNLASERAYNFSCY